MPDVFILGFTKCATTSLYNQLMQHGDVDGVKRKEPHYHFSKVKGCQFDGEADSDTVSQMFVTTRREYRSLYKRNKISIDGSAMSIESPEVLQEINKDYPHAKHIILLRNPVERAFSAYCHLVRDAREKTSFREALKQEIGGSRDHCLPIWRYIQSSRYVEAVQFARQLFGGRLKVVLYSDYIENNSRVMREISRFIGLSPIKYSLERSNRSGKPKSVLLQKMIMRKSLLKSLFIRIFPAPLVSQIKKLLMERNTGEKPVLNISERKFMYSLIESERQKIIKDSVDSELLLRLYQ